MNEYFIRYKYKITFPVGGLYSTRKEELYFEASCILTLKADKPMSLAETVEIISQARKQEVTEIINLNKL